MAKAIQLDFPARDATAEWQQRLAAAPVEHAAAIIEFLELLEVLRKHNVLSTIRGAVGAGGDLIGHLAKAAAQPDTIRALRNMIAVAKIFSQIDPELIEAAGKSIPPELKDRNARLQTPPPGIWRTIRVLGSAPASRVLFATGVMLAGIGYHMNKENPVK